MGSTSFLLNADIAVFSTLQGAVLMGPAMIPIVASGKSMAGMRNVCVEGDEKSCILPMAYMAPGLTIPGAGQLSIKKLANDQISKNITDGGKKVLLVGSQFDVSFNVLVPAMNPPPPVADGRVDAQPMYSGKGMFQQVMDPNVTNS